MGATRTAVRWAGDVNGDGLLKYTGMDKDRGAVLLRIGGTVPTRVMSGYFVEDVNLSGRVSYTGNANDREPNLSGIGSDPHRDTAGAASLRRTTRTMGANGDVACSHPVTDLFETITPGRHTGGMGLSAGQGAVRLDRPTGEAG